MLSTATTLKNTLSNNHSLKLPVIHKNTMKQFSSKPFFNTTLLIVATIQCCHRGLHVEPESGGIILCKLYIP